MTVAGVVLAAGAGSRFGGADHKLVAPFRGRPLAAWALAAARDARRSGALAAVHVVVGASRLTEAFTWLADHNGVDVGGDVDRGGAGGTAPTIDDLAAALGFDLVVNDRWAEGQATSLAAGVERARLAGHRAVVVGLADQPFVGADAWVAVARADGPIAVATFDGRARPPVRFDAEVWPLLPQEGDEGARSLLKLRPDLVSEIPCSGTSTDIDTMEDLRQWS